VNPWSNPSQGFEAVVEAFGGGCDDLDHNRSEAELDAEGVKWTRINTDPDGSVSRDGGVTTLGTISFPSTHSR